MKTSKRKRSSKSAPVVEALDSAPAAVAVVAAEPANEPVVAEANVAAPAVASESVVAEAQPAEVVAAEAVVAAASVASEAVAEPVAVATPSAPVQASAVEPLIVLSANCSVKDAASLKTSLCAVASQSGAVTLDTSAVERVDTATMQLLCAFALDRGTRKQSIVWRGQSQALQDAVRLLGVGTLLGFDTAGVAA